MYIVYLPTFCNKTSPFLHATFLVAEHPLWIDNESFDQVHVVRCSDLVRDVTSERKLQNTVDWSPVRGLLIYDLYALWRRQEILKFP